MITSASLRLPHLSFKPFRHTRVSAVTRHPLFNHIRLNLLLAALYALSHALFLIHFPFLLYLVGPLVFLLPGINLALCFEQLSRRQLGLTKVLLAGSIISLIIFPTFLLFFTKTSGQLGHELTVLAALGVWWVSSLAFLRITHSLNRFSPTRLYVPSLRKHSMFWAALAVFVTVMIVHFVLYPFLPEADGYSYVIKIDHLIQDHTLPYGEGRPMFLIIGWALGHITRIPTYWLFKIGLPLLNTLLLGIFYSLSRSLTSSKLGQFGGSLALLFFPVLIEEMLITRAQSIFFFVFAVILFLLYDLSHEQRPRNTYWYCLFLLISMIGLKVHEMFIFIALITMVGLIINLWPTCRRYPIESLFFATYVIVSAIPWLKQTALIDRVSAIAQPFTQTLLHPHYNWWFIQNYVNVDGAQVGWPHFTWIYYYLYNLGVVLPIMMVMLTYKRTPFAHLLKRYWMIWLTGGLFLLVAEVFPRLGLAYLPDRAWIFVSLSLAFFIPLLLSSIETAWGNIAIAKARFHHLLYGAIALSVVMGWTVSWAKQGRVTRNELKAAQFISANTPPNAIFITQDGNNPLITYFAHRTMIAPRPAFFTENSADFHPYLYTPVASDSDVVPIIPSPQTLLERQTAAQALLKTVFNRLLIEPDVLKRNQLFDQLTGARGQYESATYQLEHPTDPATQTALHPTQPYYVMYSTDKFHSIYSQRAWWRDTNGYNANIGKFDTSSLYHKIYDARGITIWRYEPTSR